MELMIKFTKLFYSISTPQRGTLRKCYKFEASLKKKTCSMISFHTIVQASTYITKFSTIKLYNYRRVKIKTKEFSRYYNDYCQMGISFPIFLYYHKIVVCCCSNKKLYNCGTYDLRVKSMANLPQKSDGSLKNYSHIITIFRRLVKLSYL